MVGTANRLSCKYNSLRYSTTGSQASITARRLSVAGSNHLGSVQRLSQVSASRLQPVDQGHDEAHLGNRQYWRDIILGVNDGCISTFLLVVGVSGGGESSKNILLTAIAGAVAGAVSMAAGEFTATKSQNEIMEGELKLEAEHIKNHFDGELDQLRDLLALIGISNNGQEGQQIQAEMMTYYEQNPDAVLQAMKTLEFGVVEDEERSAVVAATFSGSLFAIGALPAIIPFTFMDPEEGLILAIILTAFALILIGWMAAWASRGNCLTTTLENLIWAELGGGIAYFVGEAFNANVH